MNKPVSELSSEEIHQWVYQIVIKEPILERKALGVDILEKNAPDWYQPLYNKNLSIPIIEREYFDFTSKDVVRNGWKLRKWFASKIGKDGLLHVQEGVSMVEAAMRCYIACNFGDELDIKRE